MARGRASEAMEPRPRLPPAKTPEDREQQLVGLAYDLAEEQLIAGTASAQVITNFLKLGSTRERLEQERLRRENILLGAKAEALETGKIMIELYEKAIVAMRDYSGNEPLQVEAEMIDSADDY